MVLINHEPHKPIPTGFDDTSIFIAALVTFTVGMSILAIIKHQRQSTQLTYKES